MFGLIHAQNTGIGTASEIQLILSLISLFYTAFTLVSQSVTHYYTIHHAIKGMHTLSNSLTFSHSQSLCGSFHTPRNRKKTSSRIYVNFYSENLFHIKQIPFFVCFVLKIQQRHFIQAHHTKHIPYTHNATTFIHHVHSQTLHRIQYSQVFPSEFLSIQSIFSQFYSLFKYHLYIWFNSVIQLVYHHSHPLKGYSEIIAVTTPSIFIKSEVSVFW